MSYEMSREDELLERAARMSCEMSREVELRAELRADELRGGAA